MIDKQYLIEVNLAQQNQGIAVTNTTLSETYIAATTFLSGKQGDSAYQVAVSNGYVGTEAEWLASLQGDPATNLVMSVNGKQGTVVLNKADVGLSNVDNTSDANKPVSTATQTALNGKYDASNPANYITSAGAPVQSVAGKTGIVTLTKADVDLANVDNTSDANKPVSTAQQTALNNKLDKQATSSTIAAYVARSSGVNDLLDVTSSATAATIMYRTTGGVTSVGTPTANQHAATKLYVDNAVATRQAPITLTTTGTSGPSTFDGTTLNIPQYSGGGGGGGGITRSNNVVSTNTTMANVANVDYVYHVSGTTTVTLPAATTNNSYKVMNAGTNTVTIAAAGSDTIIGSSTIPLQPNASVELISNLTNTWGIF